MPELALMIEGQNGVDWSTWKGLAETAEDLGFAGLHRSDHFTNAEGPVRDSLELWTSLTWLADHTDRIEFGPLVTPVSFRHPVFTARMAKEVDNLAGGRLVLGVGAGWQEREHETFGFDLLDVDARFDRFEEGVAVIADLLRRDEPVSFAGDYFDLDGASLRPRPKHSLGDRLLVGGNGRNRTLPLVANRANEWNGVFLPPNDFADRNARLDSLLDEAGRDPSSVTRSIMTQVVFGRDDVEVDRVLDGRDRDDLAEQGVIVGTASEVAAHLDRLAAAGADRVMLQWLEVDELDRLAAMADELL